MIFLSIPKLGRCGIWVTSPQFLQTLDIGFLNAPALLFEFLVGKEPQRSAVEIILRATLRYPN